MNQPANLPAVTETPQPAAVEGLARPEGTAVSVERGRYEFLDAVRGIAAVLVALQHGSEALGLSLGDPHSWINFGEVGVVAFFLVSGFIIPLSLERHRSLRVFWIGRAFRLYPAYWLSLLAAIALFAAGRMPSPFAGLHRAALGLLANATMLQQFLHLPNAIGVYWTLALELVFYGLCSLAFAAGWLRRSVACLWTLLLFDLAAILAAAARHRSIPAGLLGLLISACVGTLALRAISDPTARRSLLITAAPVAVVLSLGLYLRFGLFPVAHQVAAPTWGAVVCSWLLGYGLFFGLYALRQRRFPPALLWLGRISYSFYLWHVLVFLVVPPMAARPLTLALGLLITAAIADLSYRLVERPFLNLQRRLFPLARG